MDIRAFLFGGTTRQTVYKSLDASALRNRAIAQNLANLNTPGYRRKEVIFEEELKKVFEKKLVGDIRSAEHMDIARGTDISKILPKVIEPIDPTLPGDINNVDVDMEMAKLAENQILYEFSIKFGGFEKYQSAVTGRSQ